MYDSSNATSDGGGVDGYADEDSGLARQQSPPLVHNYPRYPVSEAVPIIAPVADEGLADRPIAMAAAGDFGLFQLTSRNRFTRSSSDLVEVPEEETGSQGSACSQMSAALSAGIRRSRRFYEQNNSCVYSPNYPSASDLYRTSNSHVLISADSGPIGPPINFNPPGVDWQRTQADVFRLRVYQAHVVPHDVPRSFTPSAPPRRCRPVAGDGNCLFRTFSYWITGSEDYHLEVRQAIANELRYNARQYSTVTQEQDNSPVDYLEESRIDQEGVWGSDVEILVAATMMRTPIAVYSAFGDRQHLWQVFEPVERSEGGAVAAAAAGAEGGAGAAAAAADRNEADIGVMIYLQNSTNHFEPVVDV